MFNAWNMAIKLAWNCPRETRRYFLQQLLSCNFSSAKTDILVRYSKFFRSLRLSISKEVAVMAKLISRDVQTTTGMIGRLSGLSVWTTSQKKLKDVIVENETVVIEDNDM